VIIHLSVLIKIKIRNLSTGQPNKSNSDAVRNTCYYRWDKCDTSLYYENCRFILEPVFYHLSCVCDNFVLNDYSTCLRITENSHEFITSKLLELSDMYILKKE